MDTLDSLHGIQDLRPLAIPADPTSTVGWLAIALILLVGLALFTWWLWTRLQSPHSKAARQLRQLQRHPAPAQDQPAQARRIAHLLASGIGHTHLSQRTPLPARLRDQQARWQRFTRQISQACYARQDALQQLHRNHSGQPEQAPEQTIEMEQLIGEARYWLQQWPVEKDAR